MYLRYLAVLAAVGLAGCVDETHCPVGDCTKPRICDTRSDTCWPEGASPLDTKEDFTGEPCDVSQQGDLACNADQKSILRCDGAFWSADITCPAGDTCQQGENTLSCNSISPKITVYTMHPTDVTVYWDDQTVGTLERYYPSGSPICGLPSGNSDPALVGDSWITIQTSEGGHTLWATATDGYQWSRQSIEISDGCLLYVLR